jgi:hypothetical protein
MKTLNINNLPKTGTITVHGIEFDWMKTTPRHMQIVRHAEADNPEYEAEVGFPEGVIDMEQIDSWDVSVGIVDQNGGEYPLDDDFIDQFDSFFEKLLENCDQPT